LIHVSHQDQGSPRRQRTHHLVGQHEVSHAGFIHNKHISRHPTGARPVRERVYASLLVFPGYVGKIYALIEWLKANPKS